MKIPLPRSSRLTKVIHILSLGCGCVCTGIIAVDVYRYAGLWHVLAVLIWSWSWFLAGGIDAYRRCTKELKFAQHYIDLAQEIISKNKEATLTVTPENHP